MSITHKFQSYPTNDNPHNWLAGFRTENSILLSEHYQPEVIFIGTFNHGWNWNPADFFYGRDMYMWTVMDNLFSHNQNELIDRRTINNDIPPINGILDICKKGRISFADIVKGTNDHVYIEQQGEAIVVNNGEFEWNNYRDSQLDFMGNQGWLDDNVGAIIQYINQTKSIKHVYFTFKTGGWVVSKKDQIVAGITRDGIAQGSIYTPTGQRLKNLFYPHRPWSLAHCWVWNGLPHIHPINKDGYTHLDHEWLRSRGVNPNNF